MNDKEKINRYDMLDCIDCVEKCPHCVVTGEYLYYKGIIRGLEEAKGKTDKEVKALIDIYAVKTKLIDEFLKGNDENT